MNLAEMRLELLKLCGLDIDKAKELEAYVLKDTELVDDAEADLGAGDSDPASYARGWADAMSEQYNDPFSKDHYIKNLERQLESFRKAAVMPIERGWASES